MKEKIHDLKTALEVLRIQQTVSFDDCQKLMTDVHDKTGFTPPNFEISGNQWCALVNLAVARFGNTTPPQRKLAADSITEGLRLDDWDKIGCVNHDCDQCKAEQKDAARYQHIKGMARAMSLDIDGNHYWTVVLHGIRGPSLDEAIDRAIEAAHGITKGNT